MDADNKQATVMNVLVAHENMDEKTAYNIVKTIFEKRDDLIAVHKEAANFKLENQKAAATPVPFHPGAAEVLRREGRQGQLRFTLETAGPVGRGAEARLLRRGPAGPFLCNARRGST